jgi:hypothetical protein
MFLKQFSNEGYLLDSNYAKLIFEKQKQSAHIRVVKKIEGAGPLEGRR